MDKQQALQFIHSQQAAGVPADQIAQELSRQLGAPLEVVRNFVQQNLPVAPVAPPPPPFQVPSPAVPLSDFSIEEDFVDLDTAPGDFYVDAPNEPDLTYSEAPLDESIPMPSPYAEFTEAPAPPEGAFARTIDPDSPAIPGALDEVTPSKLDEDPAVAAEVMKMLGKSTKLSDVVMMVCERYNLDWKESQRVVARIQSRNRKQIARRQNNIIIPICILAILGGGALILAGIVEFVNLQAKLTYSQQIGNTLLVNEAEYFLRYVIPWVVTGVGVFAGGCFGLYKAIQHQTE